MFRACPACVTGTPCTRIHTVTPCTHIHIHAGNAGPLLRKVFPPEIARIVDDYLKHEATDMVPLGS